VLINLCTNSCVRVASGAITSDYFSVVNGVKQGAVLSPVLFCDYIDDLLLLLKRQVSVAITVPISLVLLTMLLTME